MKIANVILKYYFKVPKDFSVSLGPNIQKGTIFAAVYSINLWRQTPFREKILSLLKFNWDPSYDRLQSEAKDILMKELFGEDVDFGEELFKINAWHNSLDWDHSKLTSSDNEKIKGLQALGILATVRNNKVTSSYLHLQVAAYHHEMMFLVYPMVAKIPVISMLYCLQINEGVAFNSIRDAEHPNSNDIIDYLYELLTIQQKTADAFYHLIANLDVIAKKQDAAFLLSEIDAVRHSDSIISYLKATVEKTIVLLALIFDLGAIDAYKEHKKKIKMLENKLPPKVRTLPYFDFVWNQLQPEQLAKLNNLRTGTLHKKGIGMLQPHRLVGNKLSVQQLAEIYDTLMEQHRSNTVLLLCTLAMLTDDLVYRKMPTDCFINSFSKFISTKTGLPSLPFES